MNDFLADLARRERWGYRLGEPPAAEPTALCALALVGHGQVDEAMPALDAVGAMQRPDGAVAPHFGDEAPHWATAYAVLAWQAAVRALPPLDENRGRYSAAVEAGCKFLLSVAGEQLKPEENPYVAHNTMLRGWPWVVGTHSWLEPTALAYLALKATRRRGEPRAVEAVALMVDRLLPDGGCNHGNTFVLGQTLKPHVLPTGLVMLALGGGETEGEPRVEKSLRYLEREHAESTAAASLAYALMGLTAHGRRPASAEALLEQAATQATLDLGASGTRRPLLLLAALGERSPLVAMAREGRSS